MGVPASRGEPAGWREGSSLEKGQQLGPASASASPHIAAAPGHPPHAWKPHAHRAKASKSSVLFNPWTA